MSNTQFDVVIVGGGSGGLFLAGLLGRRGFHVALVDREAVPLWIPRGEILQPNGLAILDREGLLDPLAALGAFRVERFHFFRTNRTPLCTVDYRLLPLPYNYGLIALPDLLQGVLLKWLSETTNVQVLRPAMFCGFHRKKGGMDVQVEGEGLKRMLSCRVLVGGDGARSSVRKALGIPTEVHHYRDGYLTWVLPRPPGMETGGRYYLGRREILGIFPVSSSQCYLFYMVPQDALEQIRLQGIEALKKSFRKIDPLIDLDSLSSFEQMRFLTCFRVRAKRWVADHAVLLGDAAHAMNPHVAQGTNQALEDAVVLKALLSNGLTSGELGVQSLMSYEEARRQSATTLQHVGDELTFLWNSGFFPLTWVRDRIFRTIQKNNRLQRKMLSTIAGIHVSSLSMMDRFLALGLIRSDRTNRG